MASIGSRIVDMLKQRGMSQKEFSEKTGIAQSTISEWKGKDLNPGTDKIMVICEVLNVSPQDLLSGEKPLAYKSPDYICIDRDSDEYNLVIEYRIVRRQTAAEN